MLESAESLRALTTLEFWHKLGDLIFPNTPSLKIYTLRKLESVTYSAKGSEEAAHAVTRHLRLATN